MTMSNHSKTIVALLISAALLWVGPVQAQFQGTQRSIPLGYCQLSAAVLANATSFTACPINPAGIPAGATCVLLSAETAVVNFLDTGTAPTTSTGMQLQTGQQPFPYCGNLAALQFIAKTGSPLLDILFYRLTSP